MNLYFAELLATDEVSYCTAYPKSFNVLMILMSVLSCRLRNSQSNNSQPLAAKRLCARRKNLCKLYFGHLADFAPSLGALWGLRDNVWCSPWAHWKACSGLPFSVNDNVLMILMSVLLWKHLSAELPLQWLFISTVVTNWSVPWRQS